MTVGDNNPDDLDKLLADVQRTIRENDLFIRNLKEEADVSGREDDLENDLIADDAYEEL